jgi:uncharacterized glyoxalase superfamily protein PhnB
MSGVRSAATARHTVTPHLVVRGAGAASEWYQRALGAEERGRMGPRPAPPRRPGRRDQGRGSGDVRR